MGIANKLNIFLRTHFNAGAVDTFIVSQQTHLYVPPKHGVIAETCFRSLATAVASNDASMPVSGYLVTP
jgi:hypothetical protein